MANDHAPRMTNEEYFRCLEAAANAPSAGDVWRIRGEIMHKYRGDSRADDLCEALHAHACRFAQESDTRPTRHGASGRGESGRTQTRW